MEWSERDMSHLVKRWEEGATSREIGHELGRSRNSILGAANRIGLSKHVLVSRKALRETPRKPFRPPSPPRVIMPRSKTPKPPRDVEQITYTSSGIPFLEVTNSQCRAVMGRDSDGFKLVRFCGAPVKTDGASYCDHHHTQFYYPPRSR